MTPAATPADPPAAAVDWEKLRTVARDAMSRANASYGLGLCAECGLVSELQNTGGGRLTHFTCVDGKGDILVPCGRCRQLLYEFGGAGLLLETPAGILPLAEMLPQAFGPGHLTQ